MLLKNGLIPDKVATPVMQILATYKKIGYSSHNNKLLHKCIRKKFLCTTTITTSAVIMVATPTINRLQKNATKKDTAPTKTVLLCLLDRLQLQT
jgi:hypothetical protein